MAPSTAVAEEPVPAEPKPAVPDAPDSGEADLPPFVEVIGEYGNWTKFEAPQGRVYGDGTQGYVVISGGTLEDVCNPDGVPPVLPGLFRQASDGTWITKTLPGGAWTTAAVYETDLDVFAYFDEWCPRAGSEALPQPFATGWVVLKDKAWDQPAPFPEFQQGRYRNGLRGHVWNEHGVYKLRTLVDYEVSPEGVPTFNKDVLKLRKVK